MVFFHVSDNFEEFSGFFPLTIFSFRLIILSDGGLPPLAHGKFLENNLVFFNPSLMRTYTVKYIYGLLQSVGICYSWIKIHLYLDGQKNYLLDNGIIQGSDSEGIFITVYLTNWMK